MRGSEEDSERLWIKDRPVTRPHPRPDTRPKYDSKSKYEPRSETKSNFRSETRSESGSNFRSKYEPRSETRSNFRSETRPDTKPRADDSAQSTRSVCIYNRWCGNPGCHRAHPAGWDPHVVKFDRSNVYCVYALNGAECSIPGCTRNHNAACPRGIECHTQCVLRHPEGWNPAAIQCTDECRDVFCLGAHTQNRAEDFCIYDPFCTRVDDCEYTHTELNGKLRMVKGYCNYRANGLTCQHRDPCPYINPTGVKCSNGHACRWRGCGFQHV